MKSKLAADAAVDPGVVRAHINLAFDEAQRGCTRVVEVDGRLEWLDIPPAAEDGQELCFPGRGNSVPADNRHGDLWVTLEVMPQPERGDDLAVRLEISPIEALTGGRKIVEVQGRPVWVRVPANVDPGQVLRIRDEGGEGEHGGPRGDLLVALDIATSLPVPVYEWETAPAPLEERNITACAPPPAPEKAVTRPVLWPIAAVLAAAVCGGVSLLLMPTAERGAPAPPAAVQPSPLQSGPTDPTASKPAPIAASKTAAGQVKSASAKPGKPARKAAVSTTASRARRPARAVRLAARPARSTRRLIKRAAAGRFCGSCGRPAAGRFCGGCGRKF